MQQSLRTGRAGFTLLEIMLVVIIIGLLMSSAIYMMSGNLGTAQSVRVESDLKSLATPLMMYQARNGFLPTTEQGLKALNTKPESEPRPRSWEKLLNDVPRDPWDSEYVFQNPGTRNKDGYDLFSPGKDRQPGTADDIGNWKSGS